MTKPQQNELRRSGKGATDQDSAKNHADSGAPSGTGDAGPVPPGNQPGWMGRSGPAKNYPDAKRPAEET
jgi:hypothetical protein